MASSPQIPGFPADDVRRGLRLAMTVGLPPIESDQPVFYFPSTVDSDDALDGDNVPFDPDVRPTVTVPTPVRDVPCAIEYFDGAGKLENLGVISPTKLILTFLDEDWAKVAGFHFVVVGGGKYFYRKREKPLGLVDVGLEKVHCVSEDEG